MRVEIRDVPDEVWKRFTERARQFMPERGELAAHAILSEMIAQGSDPEWHTLIISDIPIALWAKVEEEARTKLNLTGAQVVGHLIRAISEQGFNAIPDTAQQVNEGAQEAGTPANSSAPFVRGTRKGPTSSRVD